MRMVPRGEEEPRYANVPVYIINRKWSWNKDVRSAECINNLDTVTVVLEVVELWPESK